MNFRCILFIKLQLLLFVINSQSYRPVVLIHGILSHDDAMNTLKGFIEKTHQNTSVKAITILCDGKSVLPMWDQIEKTAQVLKDFSRSYPDGINLIGYSQGGLIGRGVIESTPNHNIHTFISLSSPQMGEYGIPESKTFGVLSYLKGFVQWIAYSTFGQFTSVGGYWRDPNNLNRYKTESKFLPILNNEVSHSRKDEFKSNFLTLKRLILLGSPDDEVIKPWQSSIFGFYNSNNKILPMENQEVYIKDSFGLQTLDKRKAIYIITIPNVSHDQWSRNYELYNRYIKPWLE